MPILTAVLLLVGCTPKTDLAIVTHTQTDTVTVTAQPIQTPAPMSTDGVFLVGQDIQPGTYHSPGPKDPGNECNWERLSGLGGEGTDVIAFMFSQGQQTVEIKPEDKAFSTKNCQPWSLTK